MAIGRTNITINTTTEIYQDEKQSDDKVGVLRDTQNKVSLTFEASSYIWPIGWLLSKIGYATKVGDTYYNCASLAKRMAQAILHSTPEPDKKLDAQEIKDIKVIWESTLNSIKQNKGSTKLDDLVEMHNSAVSRAANFINSKGYFDQKYRLKYKLLAFHNNDDRRTELERRMVAGPKYFFGLFHDWDTTKTFLDFNLQQKNMIMLGKISSPLKEKWVRDICSKKDNEGQYLLLNLFDNPNLLEDWQKLEVIILLKAINDNELYKAVYQKIRMQLGKDDILLKALLANIKL